MKLKYVIGALILLLYTAIAYNTAHADTKVFCSPATITTSAVQIDGNYQQTLTSIGSIASGQCATTTTPPPTACTTAIRVPNSAGGAFTRWSGNATVNYFGEGSRVVDITKYVAIWGSADAPTWPGKSGITAVLPVPSGQYFSAAFTVPDGYMAAAPANRYGEWHVNPSSFSGAGISATISTCPGDFSKPGTPGSTVVSGCYHTGVRGDAPAMYWENPAHASASCVLHDGQTYYFNMINANVSAVLPNGGGSATSTKAGTQCASSASCNDPIYNSIAN